MKSTVRNVKRTRWTVMASIGTLAALLAARPYESPFLSECHAAMATMMAAMHAAPHRDVDGDFAAMMIPHHEGAIAMARAELRYGRNEQLRRLAQEMIVTQGQEIAVMRMATASDSTAGKTEK